MGKCLGKVGTMVSWGAEMSEAMIWTPKLSPAPPLKILADAPTAWHDIPPVLGELLDAFHVKRNLCLEFGVEYGYSTVALSNFFALVVGVDTFEGDGHSGRHEGWFKQTAERLKPYEGICL